MSACQELIVIIRPSFKKICGEDACRAALFNHLLYWIAQKAKGQDKAAVQAGEVTWYGTAEEIHAGLDGSWSLNKVRKELKALAIAGLVGQRLNPAKKWDKTWHYSIGLEEGKAIKEACEKFEICLLHLGLRPDVLHLLSVVKALTTSKKCSCQIEQTEVSNEGDRNSDSSNIEVPNLADRSVKNRTAIPKDTTKVSPKVFRKDDSKWESTASSTNDDSSLSDLNLWIKERKIKTAKDRAVVNEQKQQLVSEIKTREQFERLCTLAQEKLDQIPDNDGKLNLGNLVSALDEWRREQISGTECYQQWGASTHMTHDQATAFAQALMYDFAASQLGVIEAQQGWFTCLRFGPNEQDWLYFESAEQYNHPDAEERAGIQQALMYAQSLQKSA